jgi:hypothetical protein
VKMLFRLERTFMCTGSNVRVLLTSGPRVLREHSLTG